MPNPAIEIGAIEYLASLARLSIKNARDAKSVFGTKESGFDVVFDLDGQLVGAQHTLLHPDEGSAPGKRGSPARAREEANALEGQRPIALRGSFDFRPALHRRISEKIKKAAGYDTRNLVAESWLVLSANLNKWGAAGSTYIVPAVIRLEDLQRHHESLAASNFDRAFLILHTSRVLYGWIRPQGWRCLADPDAPERHEHNRQIGRLLEQLRQSRQSPLKN